MLQYLIKLPILKRLIPSIGIRILPIIKKNRDYFKIGNISFFLDFLDPIDRQIIINKKYEHDQVLFIENQIKKNSFDYFLDIGANSGYYSFYFAKKFKNLKIKAFEPNFDAYNKFNKTLKKNLFKNIDVFNFGLSDKKKKVKMYSMITHDYTHTNSAIFETLNEHDYKNCKIFEVPLKAGDNLFNYINKKLILKIDVEGHEIYTLKGLMCNLLQNKCLILIEISNVNFNKVNFFLTKNGFKKVFKSNYRMDYIYQNF